MSDDELLEQAVSEEYEQKQYIFYSSEEVMDMEEIEPSPEFQRKLNKLFRQEKWKRKLCSFGRNAASLFIVFLGSFYLLCALDSDVRATCIQWIKTAVSGGMTNYQAASPDNVSPNKKNEQVAGFSLEYIPDGYVLKSADMGECTGKATYCKGTKQLEFSYIIAKNADALISNENSKLSHIELNDGTVCDLYKSVSDGHDSKLIWQKRNFICTLYVSEVSENELAQIAESVKITDS